MNNFPQGQKFQLCQSGTYRQNLFVFKTALPIPPLIFPRARSEREPARSVPPLIFPSAAKATPQRTTTDLTAITPAGQRRQGIDNEAPSLNQPYRNDSPANGKAPPKKNDSSPDKRKSNHRKRIRVGSKSTSIQARRINRQPNPLPGRLESFTQDEGREDCDDKNKLSTLPDQDEAVDSFEEEQPQQLQCPVAGDGDGFLDPIAVSRQPSAESQNSPRTHRKSQQSSPHGKAGQLRLESTSKTRSKHSRGSLGGGMRPSPGGSQRNRRSRSPSMENLNDPNAVNLADMVKREVQRQMVQIEARMLAEIEQRVEEVVRFQWDGRTNEGRESRKRKA